MPWPSWGMLVEERGGNGLVVVLMLHYCHPFDLLGLTHSAGRRSCQYADFVTVYILTVSHTANRITAFSPDSNNHGQLTEGEKVDTPADIVFISSTEFLVSMWSKSVVVLMNVDGEYIGDFGGGGLASSAYSMCILSAMKVP